MFCSALGQVLRAIQVLQRAKPQDLRSQQERLEEVCGGGGGEGSF